MILNKAKKDKLQSFLFYHLVCVKIYSKREMEDYTHIVSAFFLLQESQCMVNEAQSYG